VAGGGGSEARAARRRAGARARWRGLHLLDIGREGLFELQAALVQRGLLCTLLLLRLEHLVAHRLHLLLERLDCRACLLELRHRLRRLSRRHPDRVGRRQLLFERLHLVLQLRLVHCSLQQLSLLRVGFCLQRVALRRDVRHRFGGLLGLLLRLRA